MLWSVAIAHLFACVFLFVMAAGLGANEFDGGMSRGAAERAAGHVITTVLTVLAIPLVLPIFWLRIDLGLATWAVVFGNSVCWGWAAAWLVGVVRRLRVGGAA